MGYCIKSKSVKNGFATYGEFKKNHQYVTKDFGKLNDSGTVLNVDDKGVLLNDFEKHTLIVGASGRGKTRKVLYPSIIMAARAHQSMIISDCKGEIFRNTSEAVKALGLKTIVINLRQPSKSSHHYNPFSLVEKYWYSGNRAMAINILKNISLVTIPDTSWEKFWDVSPRALLEGLALIILEYCKPGNLTFDNIHKLELDILNRINEPSDDDEKKAWYLNITKKLASDSEAKRTISSALCIKAENTFACICSVFGSFVEPLIRQDDIRELMSESDFDMQAIGKEPTAVYIICPDDSTSMYEICSQFIEQSYSQLIELADGNSNCKLPVKVNYFLDEFGSFVWSDWTQKLTAARSRGIRFVLAVQDTKQIYAKLGEYDASTVISNCRTQIYLGGTDIKYISDLIYLSGTIEKNNYLFKQNILEVSDLTNLKNGEAIVIDDENKLFTAHLQDWSEWGFDIEKGKLPTLKPCRKKKPIPELLYLIEPDFKTKEERREALLGPCNFGL